MQSGKSEAWLLLPLLPIFVVGALPMLLFALLGFAGIILPGLLMICAALSVGLNANSNFNEQIIVHGYAGGSERAIHTTALRSSVRLASMMGAVGTCLVIAGLCGFFYFN